MEAEATSPTQPWNYETPYESLYGHRQTSPSAVPSDRYEPHVPSTTGHHYHVLEHFSQNTSSSENQVSQPQQPQQHIYHVLEQQERTNEPQEERGGEEQNEAQNLYQSLEEHTKVAPQRYQSSVHGDTGTTRTQNADQSLEYASIESTKTSQNRGREGVSTNQRYQSNTHGGTDTSIVRNVDQSLEYASIESTKTSQSRGREGVSANHVTEIPMKTINDKRYLTASNDSYAFHKSDDSTKKHCIVISVATCIMLLLLVSTVISVTALVLVLDKPPSCQQCQDVAAQLPNLNSQDSGEDDTLVALADKVNKINNTIFTNVYALAGTVYKLNDSVSQGVNLVNCATEIEARCSAGVTNTCRTEPIVYQIPGKVTVNLNCIITRESQPDPDFVATVIMSEDGQVACQCRGSSESSIACGIMVTRCSVPNPPAEGLDEDIA